MDGNTTINTYDAHHVIDRMIKRYSESESGTINTFNSNDLYISFDNYMAERKG